MPIDIIMETSNRIDRIVEVEKFNPYHDVKGRFASAPGGAGTSILSGFTEGKDYKKTKRGYVQFLSKAAAQKYASECARGINLSQSQKESLDEYKISSAEMAARLRSGDDKTDGYKIRDIDKAINKAALRDDVLLMRGVDANGVKSMGIKDTSIEGLKSLIGETIRDKAYLSTTTDKSTMDKFIGTKNGLRSSETGIGMLIQASAGSKALPMSAAKSKHGGDESEFILPRNTELKITGVTSLQGVNYLVCEYA